MIEIKENIDKVEEYSELYDAVGWGAYKEEISKKALEKNIYSVSVYENNKIIGYGRMIGDGIIFLYIQDVMVLPDHQNQGIGSMIMEKLLDKVREIEQENPSLRVYLGASNGKETFYERFGFVTRKEYGIGEGMILNR